jgi:hypothetical protein
MPIKSASRGKSTTINQVAPGKNDAKNVARRVGTGKSRSFSAASIDVPFQIGIFIELGASLLRYRAAQTSRLAAVLLMALACLLVWSLAKWINPTSPAILDRLYIILAQAFAILRVSALLALVWWSSLLGLSWPDRELRITSGLGFYAIVALGVAVLNTHHLIGIEYHWLDQIQVASYFCVLTYWVPFFAKREPEPLNIYSQG